MIEGYTVFLVHASCIPDGEKAINLCRVTLMANWTFNPCLPIEGGGYHPT